MIPMSYGARANEKATVDGIVPLTAQENGYEDLKSQESHSRRGRHTYSFIVCDLPSRILKPDITGPSCFLVSRPK